MNKIAKIEQRNYFKVEDQVEFFGPNMETFSYQIHKIENDQGENLRLSKNFIQSMQSMIPSFVSSDGEKLMVQYGPYSDINLALSLTRLLHLLL